MWIPGIKNMVVTLDSKHLFLVIHLADLDGDAAGWGSRAGVVVGWGRWGYG